VAQQTRGKHARVVDDEHVARAKVRRQIVDSTNGGGASGAVEHHQTRGAAHRRRVLGDLRFGQREIELVDAHRIIRGAFRTRGASIHKSP
jgi:hypothetical protein